MSFHTPHPLQPFWNIAAAPMQAQALEQAIAHDLFMRLRQPLTADALAGQLGLDPAAAAVWLDLLWSMELLERLRPAAAATPGAASVPAYVTSAMARRFFSDASSENCAQAWRYRSRFLARFASQWASLLRDGLQEQAAPAQPDQAGASWAQAAREQIGQEQLAVTVPAVQRLLHALPALPPSGHLLDFGGGPGHVGIALAQHLPGWQGTVCDQPGTAEVARENIAQAGLGDRMTALGCDLDTDAIGSAYGLIWCSAVLHFLRDPQQAVCKMFGALAPGGWLVLAHAELPDDAQAAAQVLPFYGTVMLRGNRLPQAGDIPHWLAQAGCTDIHTLGRTDFPMAPVWLHLGRKA
ncbi:class I SAM-dependent methyltransferase [Kerstersia gyiorum]|uniref:class I SAM-dependent methyltransferase n=1 Tax=Kerstersia gyiorum TaxID=206506 RepID=UPI003B43625B